MVKIMECPDCSCIMKCVAWYTDENTPGKTGTGDFDCRNCDRKTNNERESVVRVGGYESETFHGVDSDAPFDEFIEKFDSVKYFGS